MTQIDELVKRAAAYLAGGGMWNPELAEHDAVRNLIRDCRDALEAQAARVNGLEETLRIAGHRAAEMYDRIAALEAQLEAFREALTPSAETKFEYSGEFSFNMEFGCDDEGNPYSRNVTVPWTTVKEIMKAINARAALRKTETKDD